MSGKEAIIDRILADAKTECEKIVEDSKKRADSIVNKAEQKITDSITKFNETAKEENAETMRRRMSVANLDAKKNTLSVKQTLINNAFESSLKQFCSLPDKEYLSAITRLINDFADVEETVTICKHDSSRITQSFLDKFDKKLKLSKTFGDFGGGIVLSKSGYDKNLTAEVLIKESREKVEDKVAKVLFEEM